MRSKVTVFDAMLMLFLIRGEGCTGVWNTRNTESV